MLSYIDEFQDLWEEFGNYPSFHVLDGQVYNGGFTYDFSGRNKSMCIDTKYTWIDAIWMGFDSEEIWDSHCDEYPIYRYSEDDPPLLMGNFKQYMRKYIDFYLDWIRSDDTYKCREYDNKEEMYAAARAAIEELYQFSDEIRIK